MFSFRSLRPHRFRSAFHAPANRFFSTKPANSFVVTTPIFYVNGPPHLGHFSSALTADATARFHRLLDPAAAVHLFTGTDEHGNKVADAAKRAGKSNIEFADQISASFRSLFDISNMNYSKFIRTTDPRHIALVQEIWRRLESRGLIYMGQHSGFYCRADECFVAQNQLVFKNPTTGEVRISPDAGTIASEGLLAFTADSGSACEYLSEPNYKFSLSKFQDRLKQYFLDHPAFIKPLSSHSELLSFLQREKLEDLSISRLASKAEWGIPVPGDKNHTIYVWLDALANYLTVTNAIKLEGESVEESVSLWPADQQLIGKDILKFHGIYWPAFLFALDLPLPKQIISHSHWVVDGKKMSKSLGNSIDPVKLFEEFGVDGCRYFFLRNFDLSADSNFNRAELIKRLNSELNNTMGNLLSRAAGNALLSESVIPNLEIRIDSSSGRTEIATASFDSAVHGEFIAGLNSLSAGVRDFYLNHQFGDGIALIMAQLNKSNQLFDQLKPWILKREGKTEPLQLILYCSIEAIRIAAILLQPVIPHSASVILDLLKVSPAHRSWEFAQFGRVGGQRIDQSALVVFQRADAEELKYSIVKKPKEKQKLTQTDKKKVVKN